MTPPPINAANTGAYNLGGSCCFYIPKGSVRIPPSRVCGKMTEVTCVPRATLCFSCLTSMIPPPQLCPLEPQTKHPPALASLSGFLPSCAASLKTKQKTSSKEATMMKFRWKQHRAPVGRELCFPREHKCAPALSVARSLHGPQRTRGHSIPLSRFSKSWGGRNRQEKGSPGGAYLSRCQFPKRLE